MNQIITFLQSNWKVVSAIAIFAILAFVFRRVGDRLERIRGQRLILIWLNEIGSDVRLYGFVTSLSLAIAYWASVYGGSLSWIKPTGVVIARLAFSFWGILSAIAFLEVAQPYYSGMVERSTMTPTDKQNIVTLIPVSASALKILIYLLGGVFLLGAVGVDLTPILNVSTIAFAVFGFAGAETLKDVLSALRIFIDRLYYVGSTIELPTPSGIFDGSLAGKVVKITLFNTTVTLENGYQLIINNSLIRALIVRSNRRDRM